MNRSFPPRRRAPQWPFLLALGAIALLGVWLRPRIAYEPWIVRALPEPRGPSGAAHRGAPAPAGGAVAVLDADGDGREDVLWARSAGSEGPPLVLYRNLGGGRFTGAPRQAALEGVGAPAALGVGDFDGDRDDDIFAASEAGHSLLLNEGGAFRDASREWRLQGGAAGIAALAVADLDGDGRLDVSLLGRDPPGRMMRYLQRSPGRFEREESPAAGHDLLSLLGAPPGPGLPGGSRGADLGDLDGSGSLDVVVATGGGGACILSGPSGYRDAAGPSGLAGATFLGAWGVTVLDADNDGDLDLFFSGGAVLPDGSEIPQPCQLFFNAGGGSFHDAGRLLGDAFRAARLHRGSARGDLDGDGLLDVVVAQAGGPPLVFWNRLERRRWLRVRLRAREVPPHSPPGGAGARLVLRSGGGTRVRWAHRTGSYLSASEEAVHFGLDREPRAEELTVHWPSGVVDRHGPLLADREYVVHEGGGIEPRPAPGPRR